MEAPPREAYGAPSTYDDLEKVLSEIVAAGEDPNKLLTPTEQRKFANRGVPGDLQGSNESVGILSLALVMTGIAGSAYIGVAWSQYKHDTDELKKIKVRREMLF